MKNMHLFHCYPVRILLYIILCLLMYSCASQATLTGGAKDIKAPQIIDRYPSSHALLFNDNYTKLTFNEYIELSSPTENIIISPPLSIQPEYILKGKSLLIKFKEELQPHTTYIITLLDAVKDITEGNIMPKTEIVFSTGEYTDSLMIAGVLFDAKTLEPQKKTGVMLHVYGNDSVPIIQKPLYYTLTDNNGKFTFHNLPDTSYLLFALQDNNFNKLFDLPDEKIAFHSEAVHPYPIPMVNKDSLLTIDNALIDSTRIRLRLFQEKDTVLKFLRRMQVRENYFRFIFSDEIKDFELLSLDTSFQNIYLWDFASRKDTVDVFFTKIIDQEITVVVKANHRIFDTIDFNPGEKIKAGQLMRFSKDTVSVRTKKLNYTIHHAGELRKDVYIEFEYPVQQADMSKLMLLEMKKEKTYDTLTDVSGEDSIVTIDLYDTLSIQTYFIDSIHRKIGIENKWKSKKDYVLFCRDSAFFSHTGHINDTIQYTFRTRSLRDYGKIAINFYFPENKQYIVQLMNEKGEVLIENILSSDQSLSFDYLDPAKYRIRIIVDENRNGKWDVGNYLQKLQAENIFYFHKVLDVKPNWMIEETFDLK